MANFYTQLKDYTDALRAYIKAATGVSDNQIVFAPPEKARRILEEKLNKVDSSSSVVIKNQFISFYFPFTAPGYAETRTSVMGSMFGNVAMATRRHAWHIPVDLPLQIDVWGGPDQAGKQFAFDKSLLLDHYIRRYRRINVQFTKAAINTKDPAHVLLPFDVNCWYNLIRNTVTDTSALENLFSEGEKVRSTLDLTWAVSFYNIPALPPLKYIDEIILEVQVPDVVGPVEIEWIASSTSTTSSSTTTVTSTTDTTSTSSTMSTASTQSLLLLMV